MRAVRVQYTVRPEFVEENKKNIRAVMESLKRHPVEGMYYATYQLPDGNSFMHVNIAKDEETMSRLNEVEAFGTFRKALKESNPLQPPKAEKLEVVGSSWNI